MDRCREFLERGILSRAARGVYYTGKATLLEVVSNIVSPSYVSLSSAFSYYGFLRPTPATADGIAPNKRSYARLLGPLSMGRIKVIKYIP
jgi:predicted transcriptional regulator of viral defense system